MAALGRNGLGALNQLAARCHWLCACVVGSLAIFCRPTRTGDFLLICFQRRTECLQFFQQLLFQRF